MNLPFHRAAACLGAPLLLWLSACGALHEEIPAGVEYEPGAVDVRAPGSESQAASAGAALTSTTALSTTAATLGRSAAETLDALSELDPSDAAAGVAPQAAARGAEAAVADVTGDEIADLILAESDGRLLVAALGDGEWALHELPVLPAGLSFADQGLRPEDGPDELAPQWHLGEPFDLDGDGVEELPVWRQTAAQATDLSLLRWDGAAFEELLALRSASTQADPWERASTRSSDPDAITIACSPAQPLGALGGPTAIVTRTYSWNDQDGDLEISNVESGLVAPVDAAFATARTALNDAETALRAGDLSTAEALFQEVAAAQVEGPEPGLARLRLGLTYALADRPAQARIAVANALDAPNGLAEVADAFLRGYDTSSAARGLVTARESASSLEPPLEPGAVLWEGHEIAAWIAANSVAGLADGAGDTLGADLDANVIDTVVADLDGDGSDEAAVLMSTEVTGRPLLWLVDPAPAGDPSAGPMVLPIAAGPNGIALAELNSEPALEVNHLGRNLLLTWDGAHAAVRAEDAPEQPLGYAAGTDPRPGHEACSN